MKVAGKIRITAAAVSATGGLLLVIVPRVLASRFTIPISESATSAQAALTLSRALGVAAFVFGLAGMASSWPSRRDWVPKVVWVGALVAAYLALSQCLSGWLIDDAGITFAYSENLARGYGLVLHPRLAPEEGYSSTLWMLWLAALRIFGLAIPLAAKVSCLLLGALTCVIAYAASLRLVKLSHGSWFPVFTAGLFGAPYLVWAASGLEHAAQALLIVLAATWPLFLRRYILPTALTMAALVLLRPEAPLLVAACFVAHLWYGSTQMGWRAAVLRTIPIAVIPALFLGALVAFRVAYFGDPLPNPFYAKATDATFFRLFNIVGGGWGYVLSWALGSASVLTLPILLGGRRSPLPLPITLAVALAAGQLGFVVYAGGDWMECWRFIAPILPTLAVLYAWGYGSLSSESVCSPRHRMLIIVTVALMGLGSQKEYLRFLAKPSTPFQTVAAIGDEFKSLGERMGLDDPTLAHHDAGGTSYEGLKILDLGGLGNRTIAKHQRDPAFLTDYILNQSRPEFIFGAADNFAAGKSRFWEEPAFDALYAPLEFPGKPYMKSGLCHIRRDLIDRGESRGVLSLVRDGSKVVKVIVSEPQVPPQ